jgi:hypothetical protein
MINLILDHLKSMLNLIKYQKNLLNMVINMAQVGPHVRSIKMKLSHQCFVDIVKDLQLHGILFKIPMYHEFKSPKIYVFVATVLSDYLIFLFLFSFSLFIDRATKLIAAIRQCEIIVPDANRIQHCYTNG